MGFRVHRRLSRADAVTLCNAVVGFAAGVVAFTDLQLAARLVLLSVIVDALDGIAARNGESSEVGPLLDSITDVLSFGVTPSLFVYVVLQSGYGDAAPVATVGLVVVASLYAVFSILRTAFYTTYFDGAEERPGMPNSLGAILLATAYLAGVTDPLVVAVGATLLAVAQVSPFDYPKPGVKTVGPMGVVLFGAVVAPTAFGRAAPRLMLVIALLFFALGPRYYRAE
ncbi:protein sorting system archaetidylserine synthase [Haloarcula onubensis]|uniref:Protein sorting system archaetidylserine synthase n=1 Tax=Haloarcula onubensis TaxID=2950539 RepID=A0ABU2FR45_9EURY|nr:protein sorting system archaetidylserine synthase [Halomicroarcula sp. S3CR25-11]MDS0283235.1 protein sorting system archaetidylserine synthase [Halomicroarcula sp. S3CR25-11]